MAKDAPRTDGILVEEPPYPHAIIPTPRVENHASFLHYLPDGTLAAVWFAGEREGVPDVRIQMSRFDEVEGRWSPAEFVSPSSSQSHQNPVLASLSDGTVWLLYTAQELGSQDTAVVMRRVSADGGRTWSDPEPLIEDRGVFIRQDLVTLEDGTLLLPIFRCELPPGRQWHGDTDTSYVLRSTDAGETWSEIPVPASLGAVHMNIVPFEDGKLVAFFRSRWADAVYRSVSNDQGLTWHEPVPLTVPNNNSSIQMRRAPHLGPDTVLAVLNPVAAEPGAADGDIDRPLDPTKITAPGSIEPLARHTVWGIDRIPLSLLRSDDRGVTWTRLTDLETRDSVPDEVIERAAEDRAMEMSYPTLVIAPSGSVHVSYSYCRLAIKHMIVPSEKLGARA
ncbi:exo-alpha-sialidase [Microbacterium enclense]|uniref:sialidase family protein n=1 Tax=Microbacterium enclense TaxID=993073 RepID=UPI0021A51289|nr:sialidase family protein [Microbacterium enclense]MCT2085672.1 exo-alpha-sialidase [Microbacterium enclense]